MAHRVLVTVYNAKDSEQAVSWVSHMLNGANYPGEITYPCESLSTYQNRRSGKENRKLAALRSKIGVGI